MEHQLPVVAITKHHSISANFTLFQLFSILNDLCTVITRRLEDRMNYCMIREKRKEKF